MLRRAANLMHHRRIWGLSVLIVTGVVYSEDRPGTLGVMEFRVIEERGSSLVATSHNRRPLVRNAIMRRIRVKF